MEALAVRFISEEEYTAIEEIADEKHEYYQGEVYAMAGGTHRHALVSMNAAAVLHAKLKGKPCRVVGSDQRVKIEATGLQTYPDALVFCRDARFSGKDGTILLEPTVIIEVLSPRTERYDRGDKFYHYQQLPSLRDYILVTPTRVLVEHFHRLDSGDWLLKNYNALDQILKLESVDCEIPIADLYDGVELPAVLPLEFPAAPTDE